MPKSIKEKTPSAHREEVEQREEQSGSVLPRRVEETQSLGSQSDKTAVPKRSEDTRRRDRRNKPHKSPSLSSDAESEDFTEEERSQRQGRHRHKKHHSHQKTSSRHTSSMSSAAHRSRNDKKRPSPPHVVLKLRRVASSPHPTTKGAASTRRHSKEYVVIHGNRSKTQKIGHGDTDTTTGRPKRQSATLDSDESCREVHKDNRRRISYQQYRANIKRSDSHKSKIPARATFVPSAAAHTSKVSVETEKSNTSDRRMLKTRPLSQSEEQRLEEVTARIRARQRALCPLTAEWSLKKKALSKSRPTSSQPVAAESTGASSVGAEVKATALRHGPDVITFKPKSPRSRKGMTLAEFVKLAKEKGGKGRLLEKLAAQRALGKAAELAANVGENGARYTEPFGPLTAAELGQKASAFTRRRDGRHQDSLGQPELPPGGQKNMAPSISKDIAGRVHPGHDGIWSGRDEGFWHQPQYRIESALFPGSQQVSQSAQSCHPAATAVTASSHDVTQTDSQSEPLTSRPTPLEVLQRVRAKHKVDPKDSTGGEAAKGPSSLLSCDPEPEARRHGNANGIKLADIHEQQTTSQPKPVTSQRKPLRSPPTPLRSPPTPLASPHTSLTSQLTPPPVAASNNNNNDDQPQVAGGTSPVGEPAKRQHSVWSSDSESDSESDDECWCMECFKSRIMGWAVPHVDKFVLIKQASLSENQTARAAPTTEAQDSADTAVMTSASSAIPTPDHEESHAGVMATMESASGITEGPVSTTYTTETAPAERWDHDSTGTAISAHLATLGKAILSDSTATATLTQPMTPWTQEDRIPLEDALAIFNVTAEGEDTPNTAEEASTKCKTPTHESSEVNKKIVEPSSPQSQKEWFRVFLDEAFGDFRPVSPTGSLHSSLFGSSKSEFSQEETGSAGSKKVRSSSESMRGSASSAQSSNDTGHSNGKMPVSKKQVQSSSDTSSSKGGRGSTSSTTSSGPLPSNKSRRRTRGKRTGSKKRVQSSSDTSSDKTGRDYSTSSTTTSSSALSSSDKSRRGGKRSRARISSDSSSGKRSRTSISTSTSSTSNPLTRNDKNSRRGGRRAGSKRARSSSDTSSGKRSRTSISARTFVNHLPSDNKKSRRGGRGTGSKTKQRARSRSDTGSSRRNTSVRTPCLLPSTKKRTQTSPVYNSYKTTRTKPSCQNKLISMYYSCEPINFFAPDEKRDDGDDGYETPWNFGVTPNLSLRRSEGGLWHSCRPVRSLSRPPPLPPPLYRPRPPWLEHVEDSPPPTSPGSPRHPDYPLRYGATGRSQPARYYMAPYHRVGVLEHIGSPLQSTSTCPDHMVARYQNYLWIEPYDWSGTNMCDMFDVTELR